MKNIWKYVLVGCGIMLLYFVWVVLFGEFINGMGRDMGMIIGAGAFLSFEMVILAGVIISKKENK